jgi:CheY-like chemotaxis protein
VLSYLRSSFMAPTDEAVRIVDRDELRRHMTTRNERIAIVDDEEAMTSVTSALLERLGYSTLSYTSGARFLKALNAAPERIDLVIVDVVMPEMSGLQLVTAMRAAGYEVPILLMTGFNVQRRLELSGSVGRIAFVRKPFSIIHLAQSIRRLLSTD